MTNSSPTASASPIRVRVQSDYSTVAHLNGQVLPVVEQDDRTYLLELPNGQRQRLPLAEATPVADQPVNLRKVNRSSLLDGRMVLLRASGARLVGTVIGDSADNPGYVHVRVISEANGRPSKFRGVVVRRARRYLVPVRGV